ncbi:TMV resistance protein N-like [Trifolium medium]|uniref:TMV resistance protein N-like n=1 Tax=Trifolium medium TaxID=97028 RepID=A0A392R210_9FABA|nr:TMV resistance protein N-like [Trifolium medium]
MECYKTIGQVVLPVFYGVDPTDIRKQSGEFGKAFESLLSRLSNKGGMFSKAFDCFWNSFSKDDSRDEVQRWKEALGQAAGLAGHVVQNSRYTIDRYIAS